MDTGRIDGVLHRQKVDQTYGLFVGSSFLLALAALVGALIGGC
jgi:hypothetical protein